MVLAVVDTETTGLEETDQIVELAIVMIDPERAARTEWSAWSSLIRPSCPVSLGARATHHILDAELAEAPSVTELLPARGLPEFGRPAESEVEDNEVDPERVVFVAHNAAFDRRMLVQSGFHPEILPPRTICTWRVALHLYPEAPGHSNQVLRYFLGVEPPPCDLPPHRALPDALVTASILERMLKERSVSDLIKLTSEPAVLHRVTFGQHRGKLWSELDSGMLHWVLKRNFDDDTKHTARHHLEQRSGEERK